MIKQMEIDGIPVTVIRKSIKSLNLYVKAPDGQVRVSAPVRTSDQAVCAFVRIHMDWIIKQQELVRARHIPRRYENGEQIPVFGVPYLLVVHTSETRRDYGVRQEGNNLMLTASAQSTCEQREKLLHRWQRAQLYEVVNNLLAQWAPRMHVQVREWHIKRMKTRWGTCNYNAHRIWLNLALAEQPLVCVEYVVVHELCHLLEASHSERFWNLMTKFMPDWSQRRARLNQKKKAK